MIAYRLKSLPPSPPHIHITSSGYATPLIFDTFSYGMIWDVFRATRINMTGYYGMAFKLADDWVFDEPWKRQEKAEHIKVSA